MKRSKGFTLIELITVLVILAVIALIATPIVLTIVKRTSDSANKRSVDGYGKAIENAITMYMLDNGSIPTTVDSLTIEYSGNEVSCDTKEINNDYTVYLTKCSVNGEEVLDSSQDDGYYHYGIQKSN